MDSTAVTERPVMRDVTLTVKDYVKYSKAEQRLFKLLVAANGEPMDTNELARKFYRPSAVPLNGRTIVTGTLGKLVRKVKWNKELFRVMRSQRAGPHPLKVWVELIK
jgi:hypothetical protein